MCLYDLHGNEQIFDTQVFLSDDTTQVAQFDASYANYYDSETETLSLVGYLSSGSNILQSGTNYSVSIQFPVNVNRLYYQWYTHDLGEFIVVSPLGATICAILNRNIYIHMNLSHLDKV